MSAAAHLTRAELELIFLRAAPVAALQHAQGCVACGRALFELEARLEARQGALLARRTPSAFVSDLRQHQRALRRGHAVLGLVGVFAGALAVSAWCWSDALRSTSTYPVSSSVFHVAASPRGVSRAVP